VPWQVYQNSAWSYEVIEEIVKDGRLRVRRLDNGAETT